MKEESKLDDKAKRERKLKKAQTMNGSDALFKANKHEKDKLNPVYFYGGRRQACLQLKERIFKPKSFNLAQVEAFSGDLNKEFD